MPNNNILSQVSNYSCAMYSATQAANVVILCITIQLSKKCALLLSYSVPQSHLISLMHQLTVINNTNMYLTMSKQQ